MYREELTSRYAKIRQKFFPSTTSQLVARPGPSTQELTLTPPPECGGEQLALPLRPPREPWIDKHRDAAPIVSNLNAMRRIAKACAAHFGINVNLLYIESRKAKVCHARMIAYYLCRQLPRSFPQIGAHFRGRDHTTILHGVNKIRRRLACGDQQLHADIEAIRSAVWSNVADCCPTCGSVSVKGDVDGFAE